MLSPKFNFDDHEASNDHSLLPTRYAVVRKLIRLRGFHARGLVCESSRSAVAVS